MPNSLQLTLFDSPEVRRHALLVTGFRSSKAQALLYYLRTQLDESSFAAAWKTGQNLTLEQAIILARQTVV